MNVTKLTKEQTIIITAYTEILCLPFSDFQKAVEERLGRPVVTHEFADAELWKEIKSAFQDDFYAILP